MNTPASSQLIKLAIQAHQSGDLNKAKERYRQVLKETPKHPDALHLYGLVCHQQGDHITAIQYIKQAIILVPKQPVLRNNLANALHKAGDTKEAINQLYQALTLQPNYAGAHQSLSSVFFTEGAFDDALKHAKRSVQLNPKSPESWFDLGLTLLEQILLEDAANAFREALYLRPSYTKAATNLLYVLNLLPATSSEEIAAEHQSVVATLYHTTTTMSPPSRNAKQHIRIAYVSRDFCAHAVNSFFEPILSHQNTALFETWCYSDVTTPDATTIRLKKCAKHWHDTSNWSDEQLFTQIKSDKIDVLIDLAGHTEHNRLGVFARKPAACQMSYLGFPNTTGLRTMDYRVVDKFTSPPSEETIGTEQLLRLPHIFACYRPSQNAPPLSPAPIVKNGYATFGSLHKLEKINDHVINLWAQILLENPSAKLLLARDQINQWHHNRLMTIFLNHGIPNNRLDLRELSDPTKSFFELFSEIDILLDTAPWSGHTIACCALWMGVPTVSLYGENHAGRMVASVLHQLERDELIATNQAEYLQIATALGQDQDRLVQYRETLRQQFEASTLRDEKGFTHAFETAIQEACKN